MADVPPAFGERLVCLALYGSAVTEAFIPDTSDLNVAIVLDRIGIDDLKAMRRLLPAWRKLGIAPPLLIDLDYLERARDVFPIELEDIRAAHEILAGNDVFANLRIERSHLRHELEQEARGKLLRLRVAYANSADGRAAVETLMRNSVNSFLIIMRAVVRLEAGEAPVPLLALIDRFEALTGERLPGIRRATRVRLGQEKWPATNDTAFIEYLGDVERLVAVVDRLHTGGAVDQS